MTTVNPIGDELEEWGRFVQDVERFGNGIFFHRDPALWIEVVRDYVIHYFIERRTAPAHLVQVGLLRTGAYTDSAYLLHTNGLLDAQLQPVLQSQIAAAVEQGTRSPLDLRWFEDQHASSSRTPA